MSDNKLVKTLTDSAAGIGFLAKKVIKEPMTSDPSSNLMNYVEIHSCNCRFFGDERLS